MTEEIIYERFVARNPKIFPFIILPYKIGNVSPAPCPAQNGIEGTCLTRNKCLKTGGTPHGNCGTNNRGVCCVNELSCGGATSARVTYFYSPGYPSFMQTTGNCQLTINQQNANICQLKIEFLTLELAPPSIDTNDFGTCSIDYLSLSDNRLPPLCGLNSGQHVYIDFNAASSYHPISIDTDGNTAYNRKWYMKITQIPCNSTERAPAGCLMYYNETSGTVSSFNYDTEAPTTGNAAWTRQINNLRYGICVKPQAGSCSITWRAASTDAISLSAQDDTQCSGTHILIPRSQAVQGQENPDRFCGMSSGGNFPDDGVNTLTTPFVLYYVTQLTSETNQQTRGFQLQYRLKQCGT
ncbi:Hypothetical protein NTJ_12822 [Nesidiocoris tenuis]|nr:Hypothetical protein NTJ_12822 [Nesidiocoris tenuis]